MLAIAAISGARPDYVTAPARLQSIGDRGNSELAKVLLADFVGDRIKTATFCLHLTFFGHDIFDELST
jgi:hypothetical protein